MSSRGTPRTRSLEKAIGLLQALADADRPISASALARRTRIPRATVARTLLTLADAGLVQEDDDGAWVLGYELVRLGRAADPHRPLITAAGPVLEDLRRTSGESALLGVPRGEVGMEIVAQLDAPAVVGVASWVGTSVPLHASAAGKLVLAELTPARLAAWVEETRPVALTTGTLTTLEALRPHLARVRRQGWAVMVDELEPGLASLAHAVRDPHGALAGMIGISGPTFRLTAARRRALLPRVAAAAERVAASLEGRASRPPSRRPR